MVVLGGGGAFLMSEVPLYGLQEEVTDPGGWSKRREQFGGFGFWGAGLSLQG